MLFNRQTDSCVLLRLATGARKLTQLRHRRHSGSAHWHNYFLPELLGVCWRSSAGLSGMFFESTLALTLAVLPEAFSATACWLPSGLGCFATS